MTTTLNEIKIGACPGRILLPEHFTRPGGPCDCFIPTATYMLDAGYEWVSELQRWAI